MKIKLFLIVFLALAFCAGYAFAEEGGQKAGAVELGNTICPVSGEKIGEMGEAVKVEYNGKIYNLCCPFCVTTFNEDPEKYAKIAEKQMGRPVRTEADKHKAMPSMAEEHMQKVAATEPDASQVKEIDMEAYRFGYSPERIVVKKGDTVKIHATSRDVPHGIWIHEYAINKRVEKGKVTDVEFVADKAGTFDILCSVYCGAGHRKMKAQLVVE